jgi:glycosyltransferase involved in cell wall biosynthesis
MRIAIITELFLPHVGGQEVRYLELGRQLVRLGHSVQVFTIRISPLHLREEVLDGIVIHRLIDGFKFKEYFLMPRNPWDILRFTLRILGKGVELRGFDAIILNEWPILPAILVPRFVNKKKVAIDWCELREGRFWRAVYRLMAGAGVGHLGVSDAICRALIGRFNLPPAHTKAILSGVDAFAYKPGAQEKKDRTILFLGRLSPHKDPLLAIRGFRKRDLPGKGYRLNVVGDGPLLDAAKEASQGDSQVVVHGSVDDCKKVELLRQATLLVLPSRREGFPRVVAEAAAAGTPTLTTLYPENGTVSVVRQYGIGWTCAPDVEALGASMEQYASMSDEWGLVSKACSEAAERVFDWPRVVSELLKFLEARE